MPICEVQVRCKVSGVAGAVSSESELEPELEEESAMAQEVVAGAASARECVVV
jgi:hypothetical protein